ncbi:hypothetical protein [Amycolatopsis sp. FDAARGOS 1241]|uniref:nSTAND3 domain-containing NTPase n=1 Tax=Amycolatopsis sp. FDAARGOS 1241 TaxID=2778070 RepID=UPI001EF19A07|nr:hypothetical protein [Amycolatopsis sp. FDAARGOS 1241]
MSTIEAQNIVTITGPPGVGKSTTAEMLLLSMWHSGWTVIDVTSSIEEAWRLLRHPIPKQVFYYDDFLGQTSSEELAKNESASIANLIEAVRRGDGGRRLVMTTRDQVLAQARVGSDDRLRRMPIDSSRVRVQISEMTRVQRARLLFNHLHFSLNKPSDREYAANNVDQNLAIIDHENFSPRLIESATMRTTFDSCVDLYARLTSALENPEELWAGSYTGLSLLSTAILNQLVTLPGGDIDIDALHSAVGKPESRAWRESLRVLEGSWIRITAPNRWHLSGTASLFDGSRRDFLLGRLENRTAAEEVLEQTFWIEQVDYLTRLSGLSNHFAVTPQPEKGYRATLSSFKDQLAYAAVRVVDAEIDSWHREDQLTPGSNQPAYRRNSNSRFSNVLTSAAIVLRSCGALRRTEWLCRRLDEFLSSIDSTKYVVTASDLLSLAEEYTAFTSIDWDSRMEAILAAATASLETADELDRYDAAIAGRPELRPSTTVVSRVIDGEIDGARQQSDHEVVSQWINDIRELGDRYGLDPDLEALYELEENLKKRKSTPLEKIDSLTGPNEQAGSVRKTEDSEIVTLFMRLSGSDGPNS